MENDKNMKCSSCHEESKIIENSLCRECSLMKNANFEQSMFYFCHKEPFYAYISRFVHKKTTNRIPTIGVAMLSMSHIDMIYNEEFMSSLSWGERSEVFKHEFLHIIFNHICPPNYIGSRYKKGTNALLWNWATDFAINSLLDHRKLPREALLPGRGFEMTPRLEEILSKMSEEEKKKQVDRMNKISAFIESLPIGEASEWYYNVLLQNKEITSEIMEGNEIGLYQSMDDHDDWYNSLSEEKKKMYSERMKKIIENAAKSCERENKWGSVSSQLRDSLRELYSNKINWKSLLRSFCSMCRSSSSIRTIKKIDRKYPYIHSGVKRDRKTRIAIALDESGSVSNEELETFYGEMNVLSSFVEFTVIPFDSEVHDDQVFLWKKNKKIKAERVLSGGTDFSVPTEWVNKRYKSYDGIIFMTDGGCCKPINSKLKRAYIISKGNKLYFETNDLVIQM